MSKSESRDLLIDLRSVVSEACDFFLDAMNDEVSGNQDTWILYQETLSSLESIEETINDLVREYRES